MKLVLVPVLLSLLSIAVHAQEEPGTSLYAAPLLGLFVTSMVVFIVWILYKDKFDV